MKRQTSECRYIDSKGKNFSDICTNNQSLDTIDYFMLQCRRFCAANSGWEEVVKYLILQNEPVHWLQTRS